MLQPPLPLQSFFPPQSFAAVLQPPFPLQSFLPAQQALALDESGAAAAEVLVWGADAGLALDLVAGASCAQPATKPEMAVTERARAATEYIDRA
jgi:hypothetical protein